MSDIIESKNRRNFIKTSAVLGTGALLAGNTLSALAHIEADSYELPPLGYAYNALEPFIDEQTMRIHHTKHHQAYVNKLNETVVNHQDQIGGKSLETLFSEFDSLKIPEAAKNHLRNSGGGHWNHTFFWKLLKKNTLAKGKLVEGISRDFGSMEAFKELFEKASLSQFGSGWAWLISNNGKLSISSTPNQDNPLMSTAAAKGVPVIGLDVWEHAYYLKYQNKRGEYAKAFWSVLNWEQADKNYLTSL
jgi:Fe-Mn family superoxide dismutase